MFPMRFAISPRVTFASDEMDKARATISKVLVIQPNSSIKRDAYGYAAFTSRE